MPGTSVLAGSLLAAWVGGRGSLIAVWCGQRSDSHYVPLLARSTSVSIGRGAVDARSARWTERQSFRTIRSTQQVCLCHICTNNTHSHKRSRTLSRQTSATIFNSLRWRTTLSFPSTDRKAVIVFKRTPAAAPQFELKNYAWCFGQITRSVFEPSQTFDLIWNRKTTRGLF